MEIKTSLFSLFGRVGRLGAVSPITNAEIVGELLTRNYTTGEITTPVEATITRAEAIKYAVNKGLDSYGRPRNAVSLTYLPSLDFNTIVNFCTVWANWYLSGTQKAESYYMSGLRGLRGRNMRGLGDVFTEGPPEPGYSGWGVLLSLIAEGVGSYADYLLKKQAMAEAGWGFPAQTTGSDAQFRQMLYARGLTTAQINDIMNPYQPKEGTPTWVWVAGGVAAVYLLTQRKTA